MNGFLLRVFVVGLCVTLAGSLVLLTLGVLAHEDGVRTVRVPRQSLIAAHADGADYLDAYETPLVRNRFRNLEDVIVAAFQKGYEISRSETEVVYHGRSCGVAFHVSYKLSSASDPAGLTMTTIVRYESIAGRVYFAFVRPAHRKLVPFLLGRMGKARGNTPPSVAYTPTTRLGRMDPSRALPRRVATRRA